MVLDFFPERSLAEPFLISSSVHRLSMLLRFQAEVTIQAEVKTEVFNSIEIPYNLLKCHSRKGERLLAKFEGTYFGILYNKSSKRLGEN